MLLDLTIVIPTYNEEQNIGSCLEAIGNDFAQKVLLVDSNSCDQTVATALQYGVDTINFSWNGQFPKKRNWYLRNHTPTTKWVLFLDADEILTPEFKAELREKLSNPLDNVGFWLCYTVYFMGKKLKGGYPLKKLALFKVGAGEYEKIDEKRWSRLDMEIHEHPILNGKVGTIKSKIDHRDFRKLEHYVQKHNEYSSWEAFRYVHTVTNENLNQQFTFKQKIKYRMMESVFIGPLYFLGSYFLMGGFRDGAKGLAFAIFKMSYFTEVYCKIKELTQTK